MNTCCAQNRKSYILPLSVLIIVAGVVAFSLSRPKQTTRVEETNTPPPEIPDVLGPAMPAFAKGILDNRGLSWTALSERLADLGPGARERWSCLVVEILATAGHADPCFFNAVRAAGILRVQDPGVREGLNALTASGPAEMRPMAAFSLGLIEPALAVGLISPAFSSPDWAVRAESCEVAPLFGVDWPWDSVFLCLEDERPEVRISALKAIGTLGNIPESALEQATRMAVEGPVEVRLEALETLLGRDGAGVEKAFLRASRDASPSIRLAAAQGLGAFVSGESVEHLLLLARDMDGGVRLEALRSLGRTGGPEISRELPGFMDDPVPGVRAAALDLLALRPPEMVPEHFARLAMDASSEVRSSLARAFGAVPDPESIPPLVALIGDSDEAVAYVAMEQLTERKGRSAVGPLMGALLAGRGHGPRTVELLQKITGESPEGAASVMNPAHREKTVEAWRKWWENNRESYR